MSLTYKINMFETDHDDATKTMVTFVVSDESIDSPFVITKRITTGSNTNEQILALAQTEAQAETDAWVASYDDLGKTWNPDTNTLENAYE